MVAEDCIERQWQKWPHYVSGVSLVSANEGLRIYIAHNAVKAIVPRTAERWIDVRARVMRNQSVASLAEHRATMYRSSEAYPACSRVSSLSWFRTFLLDHTFW